MTLGDLSDRRAVESAIKEFDRLGRDDFLAKYGFGPAKRYFLLHRGLRYDSKAIVGAAHGYQFPDAGPLHHDDFSGGENTVAKKLRTLGFEVATGIREGEEKRYWAFCANPKRYRIGEAVQHCEVDYWATGRKEPRAGDLALIWQTIDSEGHRGVIGFAEILGNPEVRTDEDNPFWVNSKDGATAHARVPVAYMLPTGLPLWVDNPVSGKLLRSLSVARAQGGTIFTVTPEQWNALTKLVKLDVPSAEEREATKRMHHKSTLAAGQGYGLSPRGRDAVELLAMDMARSYLQTKWDTVTDVSARLSFDLLCKSGSETLRVEVKGTTTRGEKVILTKNEVGEATTSGYALFVVSEIQLDRSNPDAPTASGGTGRYFDSFDPEEHLLKPISFTCELDLSRSVVASHTEGGSS